MAMGHGWGTPWQVGRLRAYCDTACRCLSCRSRTCSSSVPPPVSSEVNGVVTPYLLHFPPCELSKSATKLEGRKSKDDR